MMTFNEVLTSHNKQLVLEILGGVEKVMTDEMSYVGVLESNEKRRGYDLARDEFLCLLHSAKEEITNLE